MMNVIRAADELNPEGRPVCAAIGVFDGVHVGHQRILRQCVEAASARGGLAVAVTFDRHPNDIVAPQRTPPLIYPLWKKLRELERLGIEATWLIQFDQAFSQWPAEAFVRELARCCKIIDSVCVGANFNFGHRRQGNAAMLGRLGADLGFTVHAVEDVAVDGEAVSSTRVRQAVAGGDLGLAGKLLGRPYSLCGAVAEGARLGRKLGFPTANLEVTGIVTPPMGVYVAEARVGGKTFRAAVNIGVRPTVDSQPRLLAEAHLLDFEGDLYGQQMELTFLRKLREERKFTSAESLREQIERDVALARAEKV